MTATVKIDLVPDAACRWCGIGPASLNFEPVIRQVPAEG